MKVSNLVNLSALDSISNLEKNILKIVISLF